ncbi:MAG TPA: flagellar motor switch protein FliN [Planctomycetota bacterium]
MSDPQSQEEIDRLMRELAGGGSAPPPPPALPAGAEPVRYEAFGATAPAHRPEASLDLLNDVNVNLRVELGGTRLPVRDILKLGPGSVVTLDSLTGEPVNVYVNDRLVARGEVIVVNDSFAVRVTELLSAPKNDKA